MDDDTSIASAESAADKAPTAKKIRSMKAELAQKRGVELAELKATDLTLLSASMQLRKWPNWKLR